MSLKQKKPLTIYWTPGEQINDSSRLRLLDIKPKPLNKYFIDNRSDRILSSSDDVNGSGYHVCSALHTLINNTFYIENPLDVTINIGDNGEIVKGEKGTEFFHNRHSSFKNSFSFDYSLIFSMFSEEPVNVTLTPPYMHKTKSQEGAFLSSVKWDISSWFRPHVLIYHTWENVKTVQFNAGDALAYISFETDRPIIFKEFSLTPTIIMQLESCISHKFYKPWQTMQQLYDRFHKTGMHKAILSEIKKNLIE